MTEHGRILIRRSTAVMLALAVCGVTTSCAPNQEGDTPSAYAAQFAQARASSTTQFEKDVLADDEITRAEYEEAMQRYVTCITDGGAAVSLEDQSGYYVYKIQGDIGRYDQLAPGCSSGTKEQIEPLYVQLLTNPSNREVGELMADCFVAAGVVNAPFSKADFEDLLRQGASSTGGGQSGVADAKAQELLGSEAAQECLANPASYLMAVDER